jgi:hypothetical protein
VESTAFGRVRRGEIEWTAKAGHAREHLLALARWFPTTVRTVSSTAPGGAPLTSWEPLRERTPLTAPWHIALVIGGAAAGATGALLAAPGEWAGALATAAVGAALALALAARPGQRAVILLVGSLLIGAVLVGPGAALLDTRHALDLRHAVVAALPWLVLAGAYTRFVGRALQPAQNQPAPLRRAASRALEAPGRLLFGGPTWELLSGGGRS